MEADRERSMVNEPVRIGHASLDRRRPHIRPATWRLETWDNAMLGHIRNCVEEVLFPKLWIPERDRGISDNLVMHRHNLVRYAAVEERTANTFAEQGNAKAEQAVERLRTESAAVVAVCSVGRCVAKDYWDCWGHDHKRQVCMRR